MSEDELDPLIETFRRGLRRGTRREGTANGMGTADILADFMESTARLITDIRARVEKLEIAQGRKYYPDLVTEESCEEHNLPLYSCCICAPRESD